METESEVEISYYPFTLLPIGKQVEKLDIFFRVVLQYPFSNSLDVERQLQWTQQLDPKFQCPVTSCVECQEAAQAATTVTKTNNSNGIIRSYSFPSGSVLRVLGVIRGDLIST